MTLEQKRIAIAVEMGWKLENYGPRGYETLYWRLIRPDGSVHRDGMTGEEWSRQVSSAMVPDFFHDLNAAVTLCDHLAERGYIFEAGYDSEFSADRRWVVSFSQREYTGERTYGPTLAEAICGAFLRVIGMEGA